MSSWTLAIDTTVRLRSGYELPLLALGVYRNDDAQLARLAALKAGYRTRGIFIEAYAPLMPAQWNIPEILEVAQKHNKSPGQVLVRWSLQRGFMPLPKSSDPVRVVGNADVYDFELSPEDVAAIDALDRGKEGALTWNPIDVD